MFSDLWLSIWLCAAWHRESKTWISDCVTKEWFAEHVRPPGWHNACPQPTYSPGGWNSHQGAKFFGIRENP